MVVFTGAEVTGLTLRARKEPGALEGPCTGNQDARDGVPALHDPAAPLGATSSPSGTWGSQRVKALPRLFSFASQTRPPRAKPPTLTAGCLQGRPLGGRGTYSPEGRQAHQSPRQNLPHCRHLGPAFPGPASAPHVMASGLAPPPGRGLYGDATPRLTSSPACLYSIRQSVILGKVKR